MTIAFPPGPTNTLRGGTAPLCLWGFGIDPWLDVVTTRVPAPPEGLLF